MFSLWPRSNRQKSSYVGRNGLSRLPKCVWQKPCGSNSDLERFNPASARKKTGMKEAKDVTACVVDHGLFIELAVRLSREYKRVLYYSPWEGGFPHLENCVLGDGYGEIERCNDIWAYKTHIDLFVFPDLLHSGLQLEL